MAVSQKVRRRRPGVDASPEFVANQGTLPFSYHSLKRTGRLLFVSCAPDLPLPAMPHELVRTEFEILDSRANSKQGLDQAMALVAV